MGPRTPVETPQKEHFFWTSYPIKRYKPINHKKFSPVNQDSLETVLLFQTPRLKLENKYSHLRLFAKLTGVSSVPTTFPDRTSSAHHLFLAEVPEVLGRGDRVLEL